MFDEQEFAELNLLYENGVKAVKLLLVEQGESVKDLDGDLHDKCFEPVVAWHLKRTGKEMPLRTPRATRCAACGLGACA